jgi:hypothetical protein
MSEQKQYRVLDQVFNSFHDAKTHAEKQSWDLARPVVVRFKKNGKPVYRADIRELYDAA